MVNFLTKYQAKDQNVDAVCYFGSAGGRKFAHLRSEREEDLGELRAGEDWAEETPGGGVSLPGSPGQEHLARHGRHLCKLMYIWKINKICVGSNDCSLPINYNFSFWVGSRGTGTECQQHYSLFSRC